MIERIIAEIDVNQLKLNIDTIKNKIGNRLLYATVKANAYGHGIIDISKYYTEFGIDTLCVASFEEAIEIRNNNINTNILLLAPIAPEDNILTDGIRNNISWTVYSYELLNKINKVAEKLCKKALVHIKIDTGMSRIGIQFEEAVKLINYAKSLSNIKVVGIYTHLAAADDLTEKQFTYNQINKIKRIKEEINENKIIFHVANSAGIIKYPESYFDACRGGIIIYGYLPFKELKNNYPIKPILTLKSHIIQIKTLPKGISIGYNRTYVTNKITKVATVSCGYGDGYPRSLSNKGYVYINGQKANIIGRICMDILMVDITNINANLYDEVILYSSNYNETDIENIASSLNTISYELLTQISARVKRIYVRKN